MQRLFLMVALIMATTAAAAVAASAQAPSDPWHVKGRAIYETAVEIPTVAGRGKMGELVTFLRGQYEAAGINNIQVHDHRGTQSMVIRWPAARPSERKAILILAHMDVVEARREDWERDPFELIEEDGYFYGRGTGDNKLGVVSVTTALLRLRAQGFRPDRDIVVLFTGDEETAQEGADKAANEKDPAARLKLLAEAGLIEAYDASSARELYWIPKHLTWSGHEFLDAVRHEAVWAGTKEIVDDKGGAVPFEIWRSLALSVARSVFGLS